MGGLAMIRDNKSGHPCRMKDLILYIGRRTFGG